MENKFLMINILIAVIIGIKNNGNILRGLIEYCLVYGALLSIKTFL